VSTPSPERTRRSGDMPVFEHLEELRWRLIKALAAVAAGWALAFAFHQPILDWLIRPAGSTHFVFTAPAEMFVATLKVSFFAGLYVALPVVIYQLVAFVNPGLMPDERRWIVPITFGAFLLFTLGAAFSYFALLPAGLKFLIGFAPADIAPMLSVGTYLSFAAALLFAAGFVFQLPLVLLALALVGLITSGTLTRLRRVAWVLALALGAILTPSGDIFSQLMLAGALVVLYELSHLLIRAIGQ